MAEKQENQNYRHIVRVANVDLAGDKAIILALTKIKGIGINFAHAICNITSIDHNKKAGNLSDNEISKLDQAITQPLNSGIPVWMFNRKNDYETGEDQHLITGTLNFVKDNDIKRLKKIKTWRGLRHQKGLPLRGQRTRSNFRKNKGKVVGVVKKKIESAKKEEAGAAAKKK